MKNVRVFFKRENDSDDFERVFCPVHLARIVCFMGRFNRYDTFKKTNDKCDEFRCGDTKHLEIVE